MKQQNRLGFRIILLIAVYAGCAAVPAGAAVIRVPEDYGTIQEGIDAADAGDTVQVTGDEYSGEGNCDITFRGKAITVRTDTGAVINCKSTPDEPHVGFIFDSGETIDARLEGFAIINAGYGDWPDAAGICIYNQSSPTITGCSITFSEYGVIAEATCNPVVSNCRITDNENDGLVWALHCRGTLTNVMIAANGGNGISFFHIGEPVLMNCTIADNGGYGALIDESNTSFRNCVIWNNHEGAIDETISWPDVEYCLVQGGYSGTGNIDADPLFVAGPGGTYYLSHEESGQPDTSPCVDSGHAAAANICFDTVTGTVCLDHLTTRTDGGTDTGTVDMGYHYATDEEPPPTPTTTAVPSPTASPEPTATPTPATPPTATPPDGVAVTIVMPDIPVHGGETFYLDLALFNANPEPLTEIPLFCCLDVTGMFWFYPDWSTTADWVTLDELLPGETLHPILPPFSWPHGAGSGSARFWAALCDPEMRRILGEYDVKTFTWE
ncbi:MAG TPA: right-handed parallel beta-helix repeat-containing protein [bacterium]|nr:right-handed parallel beta-helix repeat-containing protein [bacterium]